MSEFPVAHDVEYEITRLLRRSRVRGLQTVTKIHPDLEFGSYLLLLAVMDAYDTQAEGVRATELAEAFAVHKSTVSRGLAHLEELGLVERLPDPTDGRARLVRVTKEALTRVREVRKHRHEQLASELDHWDSGDVSALAALLNRLNTAMDQA